MPTCSSCGAPVAEPAKKRRDLVMTAALVIPWLLLLPALPFLLGVLGSLVGAALGPTQVMSRIRQIESTALS